MIRMTLWFALVLSLLGNAALAGLLWYVGYISVVAVDELVLYQSGQVILSQCTCKPYSEIEAAHDALFNPQAYEIRELQERLPEVYGTKADPRFDPRELEHPDVKMPE